MNFHYSPYIIPLIAAAIVSGWVVLYAWQRRSAPNAAALALMAFTLTEWSLGYTLEIAGADLPTKLFWGKSQYIGIAFVPLAWAVFAYYHTSPGKRLHLRNLLFLAVIPIVTVALAFSTEFHGLIWKTIAVSQAGSFSALSVTYGLWFWVHFAYSYLLLLTGTILITRSLFRMQGLYRGQLVALSIALLAPWVSNILYLTGNSPIPYIDPTPFAFTITVAALAWAIFGYKLVNISPIARDLIIESMQEGMIVIDSRGRIADINPAAGRMIGVPVSPTIGRPLAEVLSPWPQLVSRFRDTFEALDEITVGEGQAQRHYEVRISAMRDRQGNPLGRLVNIRETGAGQIPAPRYAVREEASGAASTRVELGPVTQPKYAIPFIGWLLDFLLTPIKTDLLVPADVNPKWYQARERSFTLILRVAAILGSIALLAAPSFTRLAAGLPFAIIILLIWILGLARNVSFQHRIVVFLFLVYSLATVETYNYGFSAASFTFYLTLVVTASLLLGRTGGVQFSILSVLTLGAFGLMIGSGKFLPVNAHEGIPVPATVQRALTSLLAFSASAAALITSITILMDSLNKAWQMETQALNLLQQERDLLDQRVTERTRDLAQARDEAVRSSNELRKYFLAIEQSGNTIVITDTLGNIEYANPRFGEMTGYSLAEVIGENPRLLKSGQHDADFYRTMWDTLTAGHIWQGEFHNRRKDGSLYWESATIAPLQNQSGEIISYVAVKEDITARRELQEQLRQQNERLTMEVAERLRAEAQNVAFLGDIKALQEVNLELSQVQSLDQLYIKMIDVSQQRLGVDRLGLFLLDQDADELLGTYGIDQNGLARDERYYRETINDEHWTHEVDRALRHVVLWEDSPIFDNGCELGHGWKAAAALWNGETAIGYLVVDNFISHRPVRPYESELFSLLGSTFGHIIERKRAEARLLESETRFRQIVENASDFIYRMDVHGSLTYANPTALRVMGFQNEADVLGVNFTSFAAPGAERALKRFYYRQYISKTPNTYYEFLAQVRDGREIWIGQNVQMIQVGDAITGFQAVARDISEIKQAQEALALARDQALEASRLKSQLLSRVSHELRTPLGSVIGYSELLRDSAFGSLDPEKHDVVVRIVESANYLAALVSDLLDQAQVESKNLTIRMTQFAPDVLLHNVTSRLVILAQSKGLALNAEILQPFPNYLYGDEKRLQQILINLAGNAIKFTRAGRVDICLYQSDPAHWVLQVADTGSGIPLEAQEYIFEPFRQVDNSITRENRGTGLGLSIVKQLVDLMDGSIRLESKPGEGSTFTLTLPIISHKEISK